MKPALLALSFLLFAFPLAFSNDVEPVLDTDGKPVVPGTEYFGFTNLLGQPLLGQVTLGRTGNSTCPATFEVVYGLYPAFPLKFTPVGENATVILTDTPLEIEFNRSCVESPRWAVFVDTDIQETYVGIGGPEDHAGQQTYSGTFKILKSSFNNRYNLAFSLPNIVDGSPVCWNITSRYIETPSFLVSLLVLTNNAPGFQFELVKADPNPGIRTVV